MADLIGKTLNNQYFLRALAGSGATADVYMAWDLIRSTKMAVKVLRHDLSQSNQFFKLFAKEAEYLRELEHPGIVRLYEFNRDGSYTYIIMDWVDGANLHQTIQEKSKGMSHAEISHILAAICPALNYAHQKKIFHCDVKPANILLHSDGRVMLTDFGVAQLANQPGMGGTPPYMAPEQFVGDRIDSRTDVYALGVSLYEMLSGGQVPFKGNSHQGQGSTIRERIAWEHLNLDLPSIREYVPHIPAAVESVLLKAMAKTPSNRFQTPIALQEAFDQSNSAGAKTYVVEKPAKKQIEVAPTAKKWTGKPAATALLLGRQGDLQGKSIPLPDGEIRIGRSKETDLRLTEPSVSRVHATLITTSEGVYLRDEGSSLGTYLNGTPITSVVKLAEGDMIGIGYYDLFEFRNS